MVFVARQPDQDLKECTSLEVVPACSDAGELGCSSGVRRGGVRGTRGASRGEVLQTDHQLIVRALQLGNSLCKEVWDQRAKAPGQD